jgi:cytochrome c biogenesis protein
MGLLVLAVIVASLLPQIPPQALSEPQAWLAVRGGVFAEGNGFLRALGLFDLYHTFWFRLILVLAGLALFVRAVDGAELALRARGRGDWPAGAVSARVVTSLPSEEALERIRGFLTSQGYRCRDLAGGPSPGLAASHRPASLWARPLVYAALLLAAMGLVVSSYWGWQGEVWRALPGEIQPVGHGHPYALRLDRFTLQLDEEGQLQDYYSQVSWLQDTVAVGQAEVGTGRPARFDGVIVYQLGYVPIVELRAWDDVGIPLALEAGGQDLGGTVQLEVPFSTAQDRPLVFIPRQDRFLALSFDPMCESRRPVLRVDLVDSGEAQSRRLGSVFGGGQLTAEDLRLEVRLSYVPLLRAVHRPAIELVPTGMALALLGLAVYWLLPSRLAWIGIESTGEDRRRVWISMLPGARARQWLDQMAGRLKGALADDD